MQTSHDIPVPITAPRLGELFLVFIKIGSTAFGGFMALISMVQSYTVERRRWLTAEEMLNGIALATVLPGPVAVNVVVYTGYRVRGGWGALISAVAVLLPTFVLVVALSAAYFTWGDIPAISRFFQGVVPAVSAIVAVAAWNMGRKTVKTGAERFLAAAACVLLLTVGGFFGTLLIIAGSALAGLALFMRSPPPDGGNGSDGQRPAPPRKLYATVWPALPVVAPFFSTDFAMAGKLLVTFAGMSLMLFGGGFVFIPLIQQIVVGEYGWVTPKEFIDGIALGQVTPGPILISAAFIGYKMAGLLGALAATIGIFAPPALVMTAGAHFLERLRSSPVFNAALKGIRSAVIGMVAAAAYTVAQNAPPNVISLAIFAAALLALLRLRVETAWVIPVAGLAGILLY